jgi:hypothetical protein
LFCSALASRSVTPPEPEPSVPPQVPPEKPHEAGTQPGAADGRASAAGWDSASRLIPCKGGSDDAKPFCSEPILRSKILPEPEPGPSQVETEALHEEGAQVGSVGALLDSAEEPLNLGMAVGWAFCCGTTTGPFLESDLLCTAVSLLALRELRTSLLAATATRLVKRAIRVEVMRRRLPSKPDLSGFLCGSTEPSCKMRSEVLFANSSGVKAESPAVASLDGFALRAGSQRAEHCNAHLTMTSCKVVSGFVARWNGNQPAIPLGRRRSSCNKSRDLRQLRCDVEWQNPNSSPEHMLQG